MLGPSIVMVQSALVVTTVLAISLLSVGYHHRRMYGDTIKSS